MTDVINYRPRRRRIIITALCIVIVILLAACVGLYMRYQQAIKKQPTPVIDQASVLADKLHGIIALPQEQPNLATVLDRTKLGDPMLIAEAKNQDQLLVYPAAKRVILYRPSTGRVIDMFHVVPEASSVKQGSH